MSRYAQPAALGILAIFALAVALGRRAGPARPAVAPRDDAGSAMVAAAPADPAVLDNRIKVLEAHVRELRADVRAMREGKE